MSDNLAAKTFNGLKWTYGSAIINAVFQVGFSAVMARLLAPSAFGLMAMAGVALRFGSYFAQLGIGSAIIQKETLSRREIHAAFVLSSGLGAIFLLAAWIAAPTAGLLFHQAEVVPVLRALALSFLITGVSSSAVSVLRREMNFRALALVDIVSYVIGYGAVGLIAAYLGWGVWSLVAATLCQGTVAAILAHAVARHGLSLPRSVNDFRPLASFGGRVSIVGFLEFIGSQLDTMSIGRLLGANALGLYNRATMVAYLPAYQLSTSLSRVLFPSFSRMQVDRARLRRTYLNTITLIGVVLIPFAIAVSISAKEVILLLLGEQWTEAVPVLRLIVFAVALDFLTHFGGVVCEATGTLVQKMVIQVVFITLLVVLFWLLQINGLPGFALALALAQIVRHLGYALVIRRLLVISPVSFLRAYTPGITYAILIGVLILLISNVLEAISAPNTITLLAEILLGSGCLVMLIFLGPFQEIRNEAHRWLAQFLSDRYTKLPFLSPFLHDKIFTKRSENTQTTSLTELYHDT